MIIYEPQPGLLSYGPSQSGLKFLFLTELCFNFKLDPFSFPDFIEKDWIRVQPEWYVKMHKPEPDWYHCEVEGDLVRIWYRTDLVDYDMQHIWQHRLDKMPCVLTTFDAEYTQDDLGRGEFLRCVFVMMKNYNDAEQVINAIKDTFQEVVDDLIESNE